MSYSTWLRRASWLGVFGIAVLSASSAWADDDKPADEKSPPTKEESVPKEGRRRPAPHEAAAKYWLKMSLAPIPAALDNQLGLKGEGVLVEGVGEEGPAEKAGIKENDILLSVGDKPIKSSRDLVNIVEQADGKELSFQLMRAGKTMTVAVTPAKRPERAWLEHSPRNLEGWKEMEEAIRVKLKQAGVDVRMQLLKPARIFPPGTPFGGEFPDDLTVNIHKQGKNPAEIEVKQADKTWTVKEDDLAKLPDEVRPHVEALLGRGHMPMQALFFRGPEGPEGPPRHPPGPPRADGPGPDGPDHGRRDRPTRPDGPEGPGRRPPGPPHAEGPGHDGPGDHPPGPSGAFDRPGRPDGQGPAGRFEERLERRLEEMNRRMQEIHREFDNLRRSLQERSRDRTDDEDDTGGDSF
ncbi:MAG: PDZ domain-containing protein [Planctomycetia bacterium]|nr:PDZ domain-containing protein [Planctomycetia bacterium]